MLKRLTLYIMTVLLLVFTIGLNVSVQFCGGEYVGMSVNGVQFLSEVGEEMSCCTDDEGGCDACHHIHCQYQVQSLYEGAEGVCIAPSLCSLDWLHGGFQGLFPILDNYLDTVEEDGDSDADFWYRPPGYSSWTGISYGLRAPPVWA